jgi:hypothetical protein
MASNEARFDSDVGTVAVRPLAERIATLARTRLDELIDVTTGLLDDESDPLGEEVKRALGTYASRFFEGFEEDVAAEIVEHIRVSGLEGG